VKLRKGYREQCAGEVPPAVACAAHKTRPGRDKQSSIVYSSSGTENQPQPSLHECVSTCGRRDRPERGRAFSAHCGGIHAAACYMRVQSHRSGVWVRHSVGCHVFEQQNCVPQRHGLVPPTDWQRNHPHSTATSCNLCPGFLDSAASSSTTTHQAGKELPKCRSVTGGSRPPQLRATRKRSFGLLHTVRPSIAAKSKSVSAR
jgi:hypothetical protein